MASSQNLIDLFWKYMQPDGFLKSICDAAMLASISALLEKRCYLDEGRRGVIYPNVYIAIIANPGYSFKSYTTRACVELLKEVGSPETGQPYLSPNKLTPASLIKELKDAQRSFEDRQRGKTIAQSPMFAYSSEFAVLIKDIGGGSMMTDLLDFYDSHSTWSKRTIHDGKVTIYNPSVVILADTTPSQFREIVAGDAAGSGFTSRIIFVYEDKKAPGNPLGTDVDIALRYNIIGRMTELYEMVGQFKMTEAAKVKFVDFYNKHRTSISKYEHNPHMSHYLARKDTHVRKLSMLFSASRGSSLSIEAEDIERSVNYLEELEPKMPKAFGMKFADEDPNFIPTLMKIIPESGITEKQLLNVFYTNSVFASKSVNFENALLTLQTMENIRIVVYEDGSRKFYRVSSAEL